MPTFFPRRAICPKVLARIGKQVAATKKVLTPILMLKPKPVVDRPRHAAINGSN